LIRGLDFGAGFYDSGFQLTVDEERFREKLIELANLKGEERVLDVDKEIKGPLLGGTIKLHIGL